MQTIQTMFGEVPMPYSFNSGNWLLETIPLLVSSKILERVDTIFAYRSRFVVPMRVGSDKIEGWDKSVSCAFSFAKKWGNGIL